MNNNYEQEIPKYVKQKESDVSKASKKSKHKHQYKECLIQYRYNLKSNIFTQEQKSKLHTSLCSYCTICGKKGSYIKNGKYNIELEQLEKERYKRKPYYVPIPDEEIYERYHDKLPVFFLENYLDGYVVLDKEQK